MQKTNFFHIFESRMVIFLLNNYDNDMKYILLKVIINFIKDFEYT